MDEREKIIGEITALITTLGESFGGIFQVSADGRRKRINIIDLNKSVDKTTIEVDDPTNPFAKTTSFELPKKEESVRMHTPVHTGPRTEMPPLSPPISEQKTMVEKAKTSIPSKIPGPPAGLLKKTTLPSDSNIPRRPDSTIKARTPAPVKVKTAVTSTHSTPEVTPPEMVTPKASAPPTTIPEKVIEKLPEQNNKIPNAHTLLQDQAEPNIQPPTAGGKKLPPKPRTFLPAKAQAEVSFNPSNLKFAPIITEKDKLKNIIDNLVEKNNAYLLSSSDPKQELKSTNVLTKGFHLKENKQQRLGHAKWLQEKLEVQLKRLEQSTDIKDIKAEQEQFLIYLKAAEKFDRSDSGIFRDDQKTPSISTILKGTRDEFQKTFESDHTSAKKRSFK